MKYLKTFESFLILESELKHSQILAKQLEDIFQKSITQIDLDKTSQKEEKISKVTEFNQSLKIEATDVIFPKFKLQLGAIILQKASVTNFSFKEIFVKKGQRFFIDELRDSIKQNRLTESLNEYLKKCVVEVNFRPFYEEPTKEAGIKFGSLAWFTDPSAALQKNVMFVCSLKLNLFEYEYIRQNIKKTIRHELQHLSQVTNTFCLNVGEFFIKNIDDIENMDIQTEIEKLYRESVKKSKVGIAKTVTGLDQNADAKMFDPNTGKETNLRIALQKVIKKDPKDVGLTSDESDLAKRLEYLGDDAEYKPWMSDKADYWFEIYRRVFTEQDKTDDNSSELTGKENLKKRLEYFKKQKTAKKITSINEVDEDTKMIVDLAMKDDKELNLLNKLRKETYVEFYRYIRKKLESI